MKPCQRVSCYQSWFTLCTLSRHPRQRLHHVWWHSRAQLPASLWRGWPAWSLLRQPTLGLGQCWCGGHCPGPAPPDSWSLRAPVEVWLRGHCSGLDQLCWHHLAVIILEETTREMRYFSCIVHLLDQSFLFLSFIYVCCSLVNLEQTLSC